MNDREVVLLSLGHMTDRVNPVKHKTGKVYNELRSGKRNTITSRFFRKSFLTVSAER
jgi:hypothetical protein